ncbi:hypothetical protein [Lentzea sp. HUAS12]|uniref:hypothetical protein n=1 Tax=Lentzea sp. HUAS12 TaxID=2951806 RepID=UPI00209D1EDA|nr:hypothetical protein [Lentzea sp. HUAS12]USX50785.1 hypothetical protein ND450_36290 [Lentzea sp. HUAS12]
MKRLLGVASALLLSTSATSAGAAETGWAGVEMTPSAGWKVLETGYWTMRGGFPATFDVNITNRSDRDVSDLHVRISLPPAKLAVTGWDGEYWRCWSVEGGPGVEGVHCTAAFLAVPGEAFPTLQIHTKGLEHHSDTIDVYAESGGAEASHAGVPYRIDLST